MICTEFFKSLYQFSEGKLELRALPSRTRAFLDIGDAILLHRTGGAG